MQKADRFQPVGFFLPFFGLTVAAFRPNLPRRPDPRTRPAWSLIARWHRGFSSFLSPVCKWVIGAANGLALVQWQNWIYRKAARQFARERGLALVRKRRLQR